MANTIAETLETYFSKLPSALQGDGQNFIVLLKNMLKDLTTQLNSKFEEISKIANAVTDAPDTMTQQLKNCRVTEKRVGTSISLILNWDYSGIDNYDSSEIYVKESATPDIDWSTVDVSRSIRTTKTSQYTIDNCTAGYSYRILFKGKNTYGSVSEEASAPYLIYTISALNNVPDKPTEFNVYFSKDGVVWKWKQPADLDYSVTELRADANPGNPTNLIEITQDTISTAIPPTREGTAYLYNKGYGSKYSDPLTRAWSKPVPTAPQNLAITTTYQGLQITYGAIPEDCIGIVISINGSRHYTSDDKYNFYCSTGSYVIKACYYDCFGDGTWTAEQTVGTVEEIPANAVHVTSATVFDDGVIVGKYIGDKQVVGTKIADGTITTGNISAGAITANEIGANAITADKIATSAVTADKVAAGAVTTDKLNAGAVTAEKLAVGSVTANKLAANEIDMAGALKIVGGNVTLDENGLTERCSNGDTIIFGNSGMVYKDSNGNTYDMVGKSIMGTATNDQYVRFKNAWTSVPNVMIVPQNVVVSEPNYSTSTIRLHAYADQISTSGFYIRCYSGISSGAGNKSLNQTAYSEQSWYAVDGGYNLNKDLGTVSKGFSVSVPNNIDNLTVNGTVYIRTTNSDNNGANFKLNNNLTMYYNNGSNVQTINQQIIPTGNISYPYSGGLTYQMRKSEGTTAVGFSVNFSLPQGSTVNGTLSFDPVQFSRNNYYIYVKAVITSISYSVSGEQKLDTGGTAAFFVTDSNDTNFTIG